MFSNFKNAFVRRTQYTIEPPKAILDVINTEVPEGFEYKYVGDGVYVLDAAKGIDIQSGTMMVPEKAKRFFEGVDKIDVEKIKQYAYNSQTNIPINPDKDGCFIVNGEKISIHDFIKAPLKDVKMESFQFVMVPPEFPKAFPITISGEGYELEVLIRRKPINSIDEIMFETVEEAPITLRYIYNTISFKCTFNLSTNNTCRKSVIDIVKANHIFNACIAGKGCIAGVKLDKAENIKMVPIETIEFWDAVLQLENALNVKFNPLEELTHEAIDKIYELYHSFVIKDSFKKYEKYTNVKGQGHTEKFAEDIDMIGKEMFFEFVEDETVELLGVRLEYYGLVGIYGAVITDIVIPEHSQNGEFVIELNDAEGKKMYAAKKYFLTREELENYRKAERHIEELQNSKELTYMM